VLDQDQLTGMILDAVTSTMHLATAALFLHQEDSQDQVLVAQRGLEHMGLTLRQDHPVVGWLESHGGILSKLDMDLAPQFKALWGQEKADLDLLGAELFISLRAKGELVGIFAVGPKLSEEAYTQADRLTLTTLANQTAVAVANARLYTAEQRRLKESSLLLDLATEMSSTLDLTRVLKLIARRTAEACQVHRCSILLLDDDGQTALPLMSQYASGEADPELWERFRTQTYAERMKEFPSLMTVIRNRKPLVLDGEALHALPDSWVQPSGIHSLVVVPLVSRDRVIGAMVLDEVEAGKRFTDEQIALAMTIGGQAAATIENARLHEQTTQEKSRAEAILQETFSGMVVLDHDYRIVSVNPGAELITGFTADEVLGKRVDEVFGLEVGGWVGPVTQVSETGLHMSPVETVMAAKQGNKDVLLGVRLLSAASPAQMRFLLSFTDISRLKEVDRLRSSIVANVSHELRTPLASIKAYAELLLAGADDTDSKLREEWLTVIDEETDHVTALVNDVLNLARLEAERAELVKQPLDVAELVDKVAAGFVLQAEQRNLSISVEVEPDLPRLVADRGLMQTVLKNLVDNAIKFGHPGGHVWITAGLSHREFVFSVKDDGLGIPEEAIPQLFTKFFRVPSSDAAAIQGTGLGLALTKEAVTAHGGRIEVESTLGEGSRFTVFIPKEPYLSLETEDAKPRQVDRATVR
jgi:two-component system phosphate regulon sensor histidine kinase PhoR